MTGDEAGGAGGGGGGGDDGGGENDDELLIEQVASAHRPVSHDELRYHPRWHDLDAAGRERAFDRARALRTLEAALDSAGMSTTARAVLARILIAKDRAGG